MLLSFSKMILELFHKRRLRSVFLKQDCFVMIPWCFGRNV